MSRKMEETTLEGQRIPVVELTSSQIDRVFMKYENGFQPTKMDKLMMIQTHIPEFALNMMTDPVRVADIVEEKDLAPSEYMHVYKKAQEVNDFLFQALQNYREKQERITDLQSVITTMGGLEEQPST